MKNKSKVILLLGGNLGNTKNFLTQAIQQLSAIFGQPILASSLYKSEPWGFEASQNFINQVIEFHTDMSPDEILNYTQKIEKTLGRQQKNGTQYESRPIDIDILFYDDLCLETEQLTIPHPLLHHRRFTLLPLTDHWAEFIHPVLNKSINELTDECTDQSPVKAIS